MVIVIKVEFKDNTNAVMKAYESLLVATLTRIGLEWLENVAPLVPVDTGKLRQSMRFEVDIKEKVVRVGSTIKDPPYPIFVELGTYKQAAQPYLKPSILNYIKDYENAIRSVLGSSWSVQLL